MGFSFSKPSEGATPDQAPNTNAIPSLPVSPPPTVANNLDQLADTMVRVNSGSQYHPPVASAASATSNHVAIPQEDNKSQQDDAKTCLEQLKESAVGEWVIKHADSIELGGYVLFSAGVSGCYGVLAYPRGQDNKGLSWFYLFDSALVNFPQYVLMPYKFKENVQAAWHNKDLVRSILSLAAGTGTLIASFPLSEMAANTFAAIIGKRPSPSVSVPILGLFSSAIGVTRLSGTLALSRMAHGHLRRMFFNRWGQVSSSAFLYQEYKRYVIGLLAKDLEKNSKHCPDSDDIDAQWVSRFYGQLGRDENAFAYENAVASRCRITKVAEYSAITLLVTSFFATVPMWLALAKEGTKSDSDIVNFLASLANMMFMLWFCVIFPGDFAKTTKQLYQLFFEKLSEVCAAGFLTFLVQSALLVFTFISGFGYLQVGLSDYQKDFDGMINGTFWKPEREAITLMNNGGVFGDNIAMLSGVVANMGAICNLMRRVFDARERQKRIDNGEVTKQQLENYESCLRKLSQYDVTGDEVIQTIVREREQARAGSSNVLARSLVLDGARGGAASGSRRTSSTHGEADRGRQLENSQPNLSVRDAQNQVPSPVADSADQDNGQLRATPDPVGRASFGPQNYGTTQNGSFFSQGNLAEDAPLVQQGNSGERSGYSMCAIQ